jgi:hypothetical protein
MHGVRPKVNAAGPFHAAEIGIGGDGIEDTGVQQLEKHAVPCILTGKTAESTETRVAGTGDLPHIPKRKQSMN